MSASVGVLTLAAANDAASLFDAATRNLPEPQAGSHTEIPSRPQPRAVLRVGVDVSGLSLSDAADAARDYAADGGDGGYIGGRIDKPPAIGHVRFHNGELRVL